MSITPVKVSKPRAKQILRDAYEAGTLVAQSKHPNFRGGAYWLPDGTRCAIGQMFSDRDARKLEHSIDGPYLMAHRLISKGLLIVARSNQEWFEEVQRAHDRWAQARQLAHRSSIIKHQRLKFLAMIKE